MTTNIEREQIEFDVLFVGGGPASLAGAIRLLQLTQERKLDIQAALIEKGAEIGGHLLSGAVMKPSVLTRLVSADLMKELPVEAVVKEDALYFLSGKRHIKIPVVPKYLHNKGFPIISLSCFAKWLAGIAEDMGLNIFPGFAAEKCLFDETGTQLQGVVTGDKGFDKEGKPKHNFEPGLNIRSSVTIFGEGARGSLFAQIADRFGLCKAKMPQVFETGIKEVIQLPADNRFKQLRENCLHTLGCPLGLDAPGGGFLYEMSDNKVALGFLTGLSHTDPRLDPHKIFMEFKRHPFIAGLIEGGEVIEQGARVVSTGGCFTMPELAFNGGMVIGASAAIHNGPALKGIHVSMESGMIAAEACIEALEKNDFSAKTLAAYPARFQLSSSMQEIIMGRNFYQALSKPCPVKFFYLGAQYLTSGKGIRDRMALSHDYQQIKPLADTYGNRTSINNSQETSFADRLTGVYLAKTTHREDQPNHILIRDIELCTGLCREKYGNPCTHFCPGGVYEIIHDEPDHQLRLKLNPANCLHCKTCDIKDPFQNISWTCPEGGSGPGYTL